MNDDVLLQLRLRGIETRLENESLFHAWSQVHALVAPFTLYPTGPYPYEERKRVAFDPKYESIFLNL